MDRFALRPRVAATTAFVMALALTASAQPLSAQSDDGPVIIPILASSELAQGPNRFLFALTDQERRPLSAPDVAVRLSFYDIESDPEAVAFETDARFLWAVEDVVGLYAANVEFQHAGRWGTRFEVTFPDGRMEVIPAVSEPPASYDVRETTTTPMIGAPAPAVDTPTSADVGGDLSRISTDPDPLPRLYELSVSDAIAAARPFVLAFATPSFCQSATCGPTLDKVKAVAAMEPDVNFIHVEPYRMAMQDGRLQPELSDGRLQVAPWTEVWGLLSEPFVAVVAADGTVRAKFEGAISVDELEEAIAAL